MARSVIGVRHLCHKATYLCRKAAHKSPVANMALEDLIFFPKKADKFASVSGPEAFNNMGLNADPGTPREHRPSESQELGHFY